MDGEINLEGNKEIADALKEFEVKETVMQTLQVPKSSVNEVPTMVKWIFKLSGGSITEQRQAEYIMLGVVVVCLGLSIFFFSGLSKGSSEIGPEILNLHPELAK
jgi:hypothetical protein